MSEELIQRNLINEPEPFGQWKYYNIGSTSLKTLKGAKIIPNIDYKEYESKKPDAIIVKAKEVLAVIEFKQPSELRTQAQIEKTILQEIEVARILGAKLYILTDGKKTIWINAKSGNEILSESGEPIRAEFNKSFDTVRLITRMLASVDAKNDRICTISCVDPLPLAKQVWQDLWSVSGATPENCLYTFVEIFIFKYLSDLKVLTGSHSFSKVLSMYSVDADEDVLEYYATTVRMRIKTLFPGNAKDNTTIINGTIFVSKDDKAVKGYASVFRRILDRFEVQGSLENIDRDFKSKLFETFLKESISKKNWGQYFTPLRVVRSIVSMADVKKGMKICDPACGVGKFLLEPILLDISNYIEVIDGKLVTHIELIGFDKGFDKDEQKTIILAKANMMIYLSNFIRENPGITEQFAELFNKSFTLQTNSILGTLAKPTVDEYDMILTNPPYVMSGSSNLKDEINKDEELKSYYTISGMGIEGLFMEWIVKALKPTGKAFIIVPDGIFNRGGDQKLRDFILSECYIDGVISLPLNTFFTTNKKTYILILTKKSTKMENGIRIIPSQETPVFTYLCSEIGESRDVYRFEIEQNDLEKASNEFNMFKGAKNHYEPLDNPRCKVVSIDKFRTEKNWCVDRWWTEDEKIGLGIADEKDFVSLSGFIDMISDISSSILEYQEPLRELEGRVQANLEDKKKEIKFSDEAYFELITSNIGKNKTALFGIETGNPQDIPVYSAAKEPIAFIKELETRTPIFASDSTPVLSFASNGDGSAGRNFILHTKPFYINADRICIKSNSENVSLRYVQYSLRGMKKKYEFGHNNKATKQNVSERVIIEIPVTESGTLDLIVQEYIADSIDNIVQLEDRTKEMISKVSSIQVVIEDDNVDYAMHKLSTILDSVKGKAIYTKKYGDLHKGIYPVYSASSQKPMTFIDTYDYDGKYLTWSTNGFAGTITILSGKFSINADRGILIPKDESIPLDYDYLKYVLEPIFRTDAKGRKGDHGEDEFSKLYPSMIVGVEVKLPIDGLGNVSLDLQKEIADRHRLVERCKSEIVQKLCTIRSSQVAF